MLCGTLAGPHSSQRTSLALTRPPSCLNGRGNPKRQLTRDWEMKEEEEEEGNIDGAPVATKGLGQFFSPGNKYDELRVVIGEA